MRTNESSFMVKMLSYVTSITRWIPPGVDTKGIVWKYECIIIILFSGNPKGSIEPNMRIVSSIHMSSSPCIKVKKLPREPREMENERGMRKSEGGGG